MRASAGRTSISTGWSIESSKVASTSTSSDAAMAMTHLRGSGLRGADAARWPRSAVSTAAGCNEPSAEGLARISMSSSSASKFTAATVVTGGIVWLPTRCCTSSRRRVRESSSTTICASPTDSTSSLWSSCGRVSGRPSNRISTAGAGRANQSASRRSMVRAMPAGTPGTRTSAPSPPTDTVVPSVRSPAGSRTRTCAYAPGLLTAASFMRRY